MEISEDFDQTAVVGADFDDCNMKIPSILTTIHNYEGYQNVCALML